MSRNVFPVTGENELAGSSFYYSLPGWTVYIVSRVCVQGRTES